jgi:F-type H+-transporting ATPase subunit b
MPQINQLLLVYQSQWFWLLLVLGLIYFVIARGMAPKIEATVDARDRKIADDLAAAERARAAADDTEESLRLALTNARADAQAVATAAKAQSAKDAENRVTKANAEINETLAAADTALAKAKNNALASIESVAAEATQDIVAKLAGTKISAADAAKAVKIALAHG